MALQLLGMDLLPKDSNWLTIFSTVAGLLISLVSLYGITVILPNFVKQKRVEHLSDNARSALHILIETEEALKKLFFAVKVQSNEMKLEPLQIEVSAALNKLRNVLLLIVKNAEIPENFIKEAHLHELEGLVLLLSEVTQYFPLKLTDILVIVDKKWVSHRRIDLTQFEKLREILIKIHGMNDRTPRG